MSIQLNWQTLTGGPDGAALAEQIRDFIHTKFQAVQLPRFIKSVTVHEFEFGSIPPQVVLKDICDPLPDFYEENPAADEIDDDDDDDDDDELKQEDEGAEGAGAAVGDDGVPEAIKAAERRRKAEQGRRLGLGSGGNGSSSSSSSSGEGVGGQTPNIPPHIHTAGLRSAPGTPDLASPFLGLSPGRVAGGKGGYFPSHFGPGWSGTQTPLRAAVAGARQINGWLDANHGYGFPPSPSPERRQSLHIRNPSHSSNNSVADSPTLLTAPALPLREKHSVSTLAPTSAGGTSRPPTRGMAGSVAGGAGSGGSNSALAGSAIDEDYDDEDDYDDEGAADDDANYREPRVEDIQAVFRIKYAGDVKLMLTAEILLDYPMPSFVGIPVKLNITGLSFDGVGVVANIRKRVHFCFLSPEDALAAVGNLDDDDDDDGGGNGGNAGGSKSKGRMGGLLQEIKVESEIGQREGTKQSLKNVGKVEKFVLEQVRRIFEEEFVYPSFWTFLV